MIAVARAWDEPEPQEQDARGPSRRSGTSLVTAPVEPARIDQHQRLTPLHAPVSVEAAPPQALPKRASLRPVARAERGLQLPLLPEDAARSRRGPDRVPELTHYRDDGCEFFRACLSCPFPRCLYDMPGGPKHALNTYRDGEMRRMFAAGHSAAAIAEHFGIARRSVYRILGGVRHRGRANGEWRMANRETESKSRSHMPRRR